MAKSAVCIGINDYPGTKNDLNGCANDATDWAKELSKRGFKASVLLNKQASGRGIRDAIEKLMTSAQYGDCLVVHYSGHGSYVPDKDGDEPDGFDECICPADIDKGVITDDELFTLYSSRPNGATLLVISDSCHSGTVARLAPPNLLPAATKDKRRRLVRFLPPSEFLSKRELARMGEVRPMRRSTPPR